MLKSIIKNLNVIQNYIGKYVPKAIKNEYKTMGNGVIDLRNRFLENYTEGAKLAKMKRSTSCVRVGKGVVNAIASTPVSIKEIPSLFALVGSCAPYPGTSVAGYVIGKAGTSPFVRNTYNIGKRALTNTYHQMKISL